MDGMHCGRDLLAVRSTAYEAWTGRAIGLRRLLSAIQNRQLQPGYRRLHRRRPLPQPDIMTETSLAAMGRRARCSLNRSDCTVRWDALAGKSRCAQTISKMEGFGRVMRRPASTLRRLRAGFRMSKVVQVHAAIARRGFAVPTHLDRMGSDASDRAQSSGLTAVLADPDDAVAQRQPTSHCGIHVRPPDWRPAKREKVKSTDGNARERHGLPPWRLGSDPRAPPIDPETSGIGNLSPAEARTIMSKLWIGSPGLG